MEIDLIVGKYHPLFTHLSVGFLVIVVKFEAMQIALDSICRIMLFNRVESLDIVDKECADNRNK